jgi:hypothetical protein
MILEGLSVRFFPFRELRRMTISFLRVMEFVMEIGQKLTNIVVSPTESGLEAGAGIEPRDSMTADRRVSAKRAKALKHLI